MNRFFVSLCVLLLSFSCNSQYSTVSDIKGAKWIAFELESMPIAQGVEIFFKLAEDGKVNGNAGCNNFFGEYTITDNSITFGMMGSTKMMCDNITYEDRFFLVLEKVLEFEYKKDQLVFTDGSGNDIAVFMKVD